MGGRSCLPVIPRSWDSARCSSDSGSSSSDRPCYRRGDGSCSMGAPNRFATG